MRFCSIWKNSGAGRLVLSSILLLAVAQTGFSNTESLKPGKYVRVYKGGEGITVTVVPLLPNSERDALIEVRGVESKIDEVVLRHKQAEGREDPTWVTTIAGEDFWTLESKKVWGTNRLVLRLPEKPMESIEVFFDEKLSKRARASTFVNRHEKQVKSGVIKKLAAWNRAEREAGHAKEFAGEVAEMNKACGTAITASIDWKSVTDEHLKDLSISSYCGSIVGALEDACETPETKAKIAEGLKKIECRFTEKDLRLRMEADASLVFLTHRNAANVDDFTAAYVKNQF